MPPFRLTCLFALAAVIGTARAQESRIDIESEIRRLVSASGSPEWGCELLLCLANPNGSKAASYCVPPITRLWKHLAKGHAFPNCKMTEEKGAFARVNSNYYDLCPEKYGELADGTYAVRKRDYAGVRSVSYYPPIESVPYFVGIGNGQSIPRSREDGPPPLKTCVRGPAGSATFTKSGSDHIEHIRASLFDDITTIPPFGNPFVVDIYWDGVVQRRVAVGAQ